MKTTATPATADQSQLIGDIWDALALLKRPSGPDDIRAVVLDEAGEFKSPAALRAILMELKREHRK
jgi:hypothetical protein